MEQKPESLLAVTKNIVSSQKEKIPKDYVEKRKQ